MLRNIRDAKFKGEFGLVNTHYAEIDGVATVGSLSQLLRNHFDRRPARRRDIADLLDYFALDGRTRAILLYVEAIKDARKFMSAARAAARIKPVVIVKSGRMALGAKAAMRLHCASGMP